jgi:hypothetical protein
MKSFRPSSGVYRHLPQAYEEDEVSDNEYDFDNNLELEDGEIPLPFM